LTLRINLRHNLWKTYASTCQSIYLECSSKVTWCHLKHFTHFCTRTSSASRIMTPVENITQILVSYHPTIQYTPCLKNSQNCFLDMVCTWTHTDPLYFSIFLLQLCLHLSQPFLSRPMTFFSLKHTSSSLTHYWPYTLHWNSISQNPCAWTVTDSCKTLWTSANNHTSRKYIMNAIQIGTGYNRDLHKYYQHNWLKTSLFQ